MAHPMPISMGQRSLLIVIAIGAMSVTIQGHKVSLLMMAMMSWRCQAVAQAVLAFWSASELVGTNRNKNSTYFPTVLLTYLLAHFLIFGRGSSLFTGASLAMERRIL